VLQTELPRDWKIPKFTKFDKDTSESTVEHITRYLTEVGDLANNENLKMKYFPNSLTKNAFTWFTTLPPYSVGYALKSQLQEVKKICVQCCRLREVQLACVSFVSDSASCMREALLAGTKFGFVQIL
jgi:hypothetical protein